MKKILLVTVGFCLFVSSFGQNEYKKRSSFGLHFVLNDFKTAQSIRSSGLANASNSKTWHKTNTMNAGLAISYLQGMNPHLDFVGTLSGTFLNYPNAKTPTVDPRLLLEGAATLNLKLLSDKYILNPFLTAGIGGSKFGGYYGAFVPLGVGMQVKLVDEVYILLNSQYRVPITENVSYHFYHSFGIAANLFKKKEPVPVVITIPVVEPPKDRDGDGIIDAEDNCPDVPGFARYKGCPIPDRDKDGINDEEDKCPDVPGFARYQGCPIPDTDGDGMNDEVDKCPTVPGLARYQGCPIPDTDGDGINDETDRCPKTPGIPENMGCPDLIIYYLRNESNLSDEDKVQLDKVVTFLTNNPDLTVVLEGHASALGTDAKNMKLTEERCAKSKAYIVSKGVSADRMTTKAYGETKTIGDQNTEEGRAKSRRLQVKINF